MNNLISQSTTFTSHTFSLTFLFNFSWLLTVGLEPKVVVFFIACVFIYVATCEHSHVAAHLIDLTFPPHRTAPSLCV